MIQLDEFLANVNPCSNNVNVRIAETNSNKLRYSNVEPFTKVRFLSYASRAFRFNRIEVCTNVIIDRDLSRFLPFVRLDRS